MTAPYSDALAYSVGRAKFVEKLSLRNTALKDDHAIKIIKNIIIYVLHQPSDLVQDENGEIDHRQMQESVEVYYQTKL